MIVESQLTFPKFLKVSFIIAYKKPLVIGINVFSLLYIVLPFIFPAFFHSEVFHYLQLYFALILVFLPLGLYLRAKRNFTSSKMFSEKRTFEFTDDKMICIGESFKSEVLLDKIYKVQETGHWILIYLSPYQAYFISEEAFGDKLDEFRQLVKSKPIKQKLRA